MEVTREQLAGAIETVHARLDGHLGELSSDALAKRLLGALPAAEPEPDDATEAQVRADERRKCAQELRTYASGLMKVAIGLVTAGDDTNGLPKVSRAAAFDSAAGLLEEAGRNGNG